MRRNDRLAFVTFLVAWVAVIALLRLVRWLLCWG